MIPITAITVSEAVKACRACTVYHYTAGNICMKSAVVLSQGSIHLGEIDVIKDKFGSSLIAAA